MAEDTKIDSAVPRLRHEGSSADFHTVWSFRHLAIRQAAAIGLLAVLPAFGNWVWRRPSPGIASQKAMIHQAAQQDPAPPAIDADDMIDPTQAAALGKIVLWIDARHKADWERAHIPGALLLNEDDWDNLFPEVVQRWSPERRVVVYCDGGTCQASRQVAARLRDAGIPDAVALRGGWPAWVKQFGKPEENAKR